MSLGDSVRLLAVVPPDQQIASSEKNEPWTIPFQLRRDEKPATFLGRKCISMLEILRCLSPTCRHALEKTFLFKASTASIQELESLLSREQPTAIVFGNLDLRLYPLALSLLESGQPYGIIAHGCEIARFANNKMNDLVIRGTMLRGASWIAANSSHTKSLLDTWRIPPGRVDIIYPPISEEVMKKSAVWQAATKKENDFNIVTICRLVKGKGIDLVLRALPILATRGINYRYVIGGDGPERGSLEEFVDKLGLRDKVHFLGAVAGEQKWQLLRDADVFVMPSRFDQTIPWRESFGIAFAEAAAFGVPSVASNSGGIPDAVLDGETGILVPEESSSDLADALTFLHRNPGTRKQMGLAGRERARREFSPTAIAVRFRDEVAKSTARI